MAESAKAKALRQFALDRCRDAATAANDNSRPMAQAALLINGAAATAVIAFLTKDRIEPVFLKMIPVCLVFYGLGVIAAAIAMYNMTESLDYWNAYWEKTAYGESQREINKQFDLGERFWKRVQKLFYISIGCFVLGSGAFAWALLQLPLPVFIAGPG